MGYFTDNEISEDRSAEQPPVTLERIRSILDELDAPYSEAADYEELSLDFSNVAASIHFGGSNQPFLVFKGLWLPDLTQSDYPRALDLVNSYNSSFYLPKMFLTHSTSDKVWVSAEQSIDIRDGPSTPQLRGQTRSCLASLINCFKDWGEHYPHLVREIGGEE